MIFIKYQMMELILIWNAIIEQIVRGGQNIYLIESGEI